MKHTLFAFVLLSNLLGCASTAYYVPEDKPEDALPAAIENTVLLFVETSEGPQGICSGVLVDHKIITAEHCTGGNLTVGFHSDGHIERYSVKVLYSDEVQDVAVLGSASSKVFPGGAVLAPNTPTWGRPVVIVGHPLGLTDSVVTGVVSNPDRTDMDGRHWLQVSAPVFYGNSGGPVFNGYGEVIGIVSFFVGTPHLAGCVHLDEVRKAVHKSN